MTPYYEDPWLTVYQGDCKAVMAELPAESVHCVVTSPPYWGLRDYGQTDQLGLEATPEEYVANLVAVFREVRRVLRNDGTVWLNLGDSYGGNDSNNTRGDGAGGGAARGEQAFGTARGLVKYGTRSKDLVGIPWRVAFALQADGWYLRSAITWCKANPMPESVTDRPTNATEMLFLLSKSARYFYDQEAVREPAQQGSQAAVREVGEGSGDYPPSPRYTGGEGAGSGSITPLLLHREGQGGAEAVHPEREGEGEPRSWEPQASSRHGDREHADSGGMGRDQGRSTSAMPLLWPAGTADDGSPHPAVEGRSPQPGERRGGVPELQQLEGQSVGRNLRNWWVIPTQPWKGAHFATFPRKLVEPCVKAGTSERGVCPECGAPWVRVVERESSVPTRENYHGEGVVPRNRGGAGRAGGYYPKSETTGWRPSCAHYPATDCLGCSPDPEATAAHNGHHHALVESIPATVLDPFAGSGTTGVVAQSLNRRAILIDLNGDYLVQAMQRNRDIPLGLGAA